MADYQPSVIKIITAVEHIRARPGMYVGAGGIEHLLWEVVGNAINEHLAGRATWLRVRIDGDEISVENDGDGMPPGPWRDTNTPAVEVFLTQLSLWPKHPHVHVGHTMMGSVSR